MSQATRTHAATSCAAASRIWTAPEAAAFVDSLRSDLRAAGVFRGDKPGYVVRACGVVAVTLLAWRWGFTVDGWMAQIAFGMLAGYAGVQAAALAHEAGHGAVTRSCAWTRSTGQLFMTFVVGASFAQWVERHSAHHVHPNSALDPDVRPGLFSFSERDARSARGVAAWCTRRQHWLLPPLATLMGFSLKLAGWRGVLRAPRRKALDLALLVAHVFFWIVWPAQHVGMAAALAHYGLLTWAEGIYLSFVFLPNHLGEPTGEAAAHWPPALRQIVTARNLPANPLMTHLCIGLNTHIEHHMFGHIPSTRLGAARAATKRACLANAIPYRECSIWGAFAEVQNHNRRMARLACEAAAARARN